MPKKTTENGGRAWTYSRMSLTSSGGHVRTRILRPSPTSEEYHHQNRLLPSHTSKTKTSPVGINNPALLVSQPETSEGNAVDSFRSSSQTPPSSNFRSTSPNPPTNFSFQSRIQPHPPGCDFRESQQTSSVHTFRPFMPTTTIPRPYHLEVKAPSNGYRDLRHCAEVMLRSSNFLSPEAPRDKGQKIYAAFLLGGLGYMLPFICFVVAVDYYQFRYPDSTILFDLTLATILAGTLGVVLNNLAVEVLSLNSRLTLGYVTSTSLLLLLTTCDVVLGLFTPRDGYWVTLGCVSAVAVGCAVQQSSYYGYANMLPRRYRKAVMVGESFAGTLVSTNRIATKLVLPDPRLGTASFYFISAGIVLACWVTSVCIRDSRFVKFHLVSCTKRRGRYRDESVESESDLEFDVLDDDLDELTRHARSESGPFLGFDLTRSEVRIRTSGHPVRPDNLMNKCSAFALFKDRLRVRWQVTKRIYPYMIAFSLVFYVTASVYPGIMSEMSSCRMGSWLPVVLMACYNIADTLGRVVTPVKKNLSRRRLVCSALIRFSFIPLALMCCMPRVKPIFSGEVWPILLAISLGFSNGYYGSLPLVLAPGRVPHRFRELCGNTMMLAFAFAIVCGAFTSYGLRLLIGPHSGVHACAAENNSSAISRHNGRPPLALA